MAKLSNSPNIIRCTEPLVWFAGTNQVDFDYRMPCQARAAGNKGASGRASSQIQLPRLLQPWAREISQFTVYKVYAFPCLVQQAYLLLTSSIGSVPILAGDDPRAFITWGTRRRDQKNHATASPSTITDDVVPLRHYSHGERAGGRPTASAALPGATDGARR